MSEAVAAVAKHEVRSHSSKAGIIFPIGRIRRHLREGHYATRISADAPVYLASVMEHVVREILEAAGNNAARRNKKSISTRHVFLAIKELPDFDEVFGKNIIIPHSGVYAPAKKEKSEKKRSSTQTKTQEN